MRKFNVKRKNVVIDAKFRAKGLWNSDDLSDDTFIENSHWNSIDITPENYNTAFGVIQ